MTETAIAAAPRRAAFIFVFFTVLLDMLALGVIIPVLPHLVLDFVGGDHMRAAEIYGLFATVWALMQFLFSPLQGAMSDRFGRRPVILASNFGLGLDYILMAVAPTLALLFVGRVISGMAAASISTSYAYISDVTPPEQRAAKFGMMGVAFGVGFIIGPALGGLLGSIDPRLPFWVAAGLEPAQRVLRPVRAAGVAAAGTARRILVATRQSARGAETAALAQRAVRTGDRSACSTVLPMRRFRP